MALNPKFAQVQGLGFKPSCRIKTSRVKRTLNKVEDKELYKHKTTMNVKNA